MHNAPQVASDCCATFQCAFVSTGSGSVSVKCSLEGSGVVSLVSVLAALTIICFFLALVAECPERLCSFLSWRLYLLGKTAYKQLGTLYGVSVHISLQQTNMFPMRGEAAIFPWKLDQQCLEGAERWPGCKNRRN